ncbi:MAG: hypothetical protein JO029_11240 [Candidatus Eremiobacteraeota bacterium]|nr:hypothetical protein [Candidatus Eremiobacteraeota bacterium]MBV8283240.1 hypothetical protein [Candidatus Eremiobacteraeota bacterium]MBV8434842.1 hypothetical protein [Candidatus Eremiobacteraeota bacterium]
MARSFARLGPLVLAAILMAPASAVAQGSQPNASPAPDQIHYTTTITNAYGSKYPTAGHLDIEIFSSGILRGYYHNAYEKAFIPVTGGRDGSYIWFDIGPTINDLGIGIAPGTRLHVVATVDNDNSFRGQLYPEVSGPDAGAYSNYLNAQGPRGQYLFAAKPTEKSAEDYPGTF